MKMKKLLVALTLLMLFTFPTYAADAVSGSFKRIKSFDYGTAEWEINIQGGETVYTYVVTDWATTDPPCENIGMRRPCGTWQQILMNSGYSGTKMTLGRGNVNSSGPFTIVCPPIQGMSNGGELKCEASSGGSEIYCSGSQSKNANWTFKR
jgi:opacity protein-like surface antigen